MASRQAVIAAFALILLGALVVYSLRRPTLRPGWTIVRPPTNTAAIAVQGDTVWVGAEDGVFAIDRRTSAVRAAEPGQPRLQGVRDVLVARNGSLLVAHAGGLATRSGGSWQVTGGEPWPPGPYFCLCEDRTGRVWIGRDGGLLVVDGQGPHLLTGREAVPLGQVDTLFEDRDGFLWAGSSSPVGGGLARFDGTSWHLFSTRDGLAHNSVSQVIQDRDGGLWVATGFASRGAASRFAHGRWTTVTKADGLAGEKVRSVFQDREGRLWFGSEYSGVAFRNENRWDIVTPRSGLAGWEVRDIVQDADGVIWLATENGVSRVGPGVGERQSVVVYTSVDQVYSEPVLRQFEQRTGIRVLAVYDVEAAKTTGLVNRLIAERRRPQADVFWSGEFVQTIQLKERGTLAAYRSPAASDIPPEFRDETGYWTGFAGRARVFLVNTKRVPAGAEPRSLFDLVNTAIPPGEIGLALPLFGTSATQAAALYATKGATFARTFFETLRRRGVRIVDGNATVRDMVADGRLILGVTDTDDACGAVERGAPVRVIVPDQEPGGFGTLVVPSTVALVAGTPHEIPAKALIDFLVAAETEQLLVDAGWSHVPVRPLPVKSGCLPAARILRTDVPFSNVFASLAPARRELTEIFVR